MKYKQWTAAPCDIPAARKLEQTGISPLSALVLSARGFRDPEEAKAFLSCDAERLHAPTLMKDMDRAVARIEQALSAGEYICVYGDYDVDGITSTCLLTDYLRRRGGRVIPYVPERLREGYSLNCATVGALAKQQVSLIITVDCGITNLEEIAYAGELGIDVVVTDHHECKPELPAACAIVNPHQPDCPYPFPALAGVGVTLKLVLAMGGPEQEEALLDRYADLAAVGTVADVMELTGENRAIVALGIQRLNELRRVGFAMLLQEARLGEKPVTASFISFSIAPRINAAGRMGCPALAVELLLTEDPEQATVLARQLCQLNRERQMVEQDIFSQCTALLDARPSLRDSAIILSGENWHQGVVGIVASRLVERYGVPVFMVCMEDGHGKGSCRSDGSFPLFSALEQCQDLLEGFGGHEQAAGFTIHERQLPAFRRRMTQLVRAWPEKDASGDALTIDVTLPDPSLLTRANILGLEELAPYGMGNPRPTFQLERVKLTNFSCVGGGRHTRMQVECRGQLLDAIFFSATPQAAGLRSGMLLDLAFYPQINRFRGTANIQLLITDIRRSPSPATREMRLYQRFRAGDTLTNRELLRLLPDRQDFVVTWRYLTRCARQGPILEQPLHLSAKITRAFGLPCVCSRTLVCLDVMQERGLIDLYSEAEQLRITLRQVDQKVDLEESVILRDLRSQLKE